MEEKRKEMVHFDDLDFTAICSFNQVSIEFNLYKIEARDGDKPLWHKKDSPCHPDPVDNIEDAECYLQGFVKWDGCSNWYFEEQDRCMIHGCSREDLVRLGEVMARCWDYTANNLESWDR